MVSLVQPELLSQASLTPVRFDVTDQVFPLSEELSIAGWVCTPPKLPECPIVLVCLPGASYTKAYWHLEVPSFTPEAYSFALEMIRQGFVVIALDHLGVGESSTPDGMLLTMKVLAHANAVATRQLTERLQAGTLIPGLAPIPRPRLIGIGHSMGASLLLEQQVTAQSFAAIALLGYTNGQITLPDDIAQEQLVRSVTLEWPGYVDLDRGSLHRFFYAEDVPAQVIAADYQQASRCPAGILNDLSLPNHLHPRANQLRVPLFLANGDLDASPAFLEEATAYEACRDLTLFQLAGSAHCHNFASTRHVLWKRLAQWCQAQAGEFHR
jgi:alpha-beta hydrolase superfamily lysophospholipase